MTDILLPTAHQYPYDEMVIEIVHQLSKKQWKAHDSDVTFFSYEGGTRLDKITSKQYELALLFGRRQARRGTEWYDTGAIQSLIIPGKRLDAYSDFSMKLEVYVGTTWQRDRQDFISGWEHVHSKLHKKPRTYVRYKPSDALTSGIRYCPLGLPRYFIADSDLGREYSPEGEEPAWYDASTIFDEFIQYLQGFLTFIS